MRLSPDYRLVYKQIYSRRLATPLICEVDARSAGNDVLPPKHCFTILPRCALQRWLRTLKCPKSSHLSILELGCGLGGLSNWIVENTDWRVVAVDGCSLAIDMAHELNAHPRIQFMRSDFDTLPDDGRLFDAVLSLDALYQAEDVANTLRQVRKRIKKNAPLVFTIYCSLHGQNGARYSLERWLTWLGQVDLTIETVRNVSRFWRQQMRKRHSTRVAMTADIIASDGPNAIPDIHVSRSILTGLRQRQCTLEGISRYEIVARRC